MSLNKTEQFCGECGLPVADHHFSLSRRLDVMSNQEIDGKTVRSIQVLSDDLLLHFCDDDCWSFKEPAVVAAFELKTTYPSFHWIADCSVCGSPVNRTKPYVTLNVCELIDDSQPWLSTARMLDDREFAVFCNVCDAPGRTGDIAQESEPDEQPLPHLVLAGENG